MDKPYDNTNIIAFIKNENEAPYDRGEAILEIGEYIESIGMDKYIASLLHHEHNYLRAIAIRVLFRRLKIDEYYYNAIQILKKDNSRYVIEKALDAIVEYFFIKKKYKNKFLRVLGKLYIEFKDDELMIDEILFCISMLQDPNPEKMEKSMSLDPIDWKKEIDWEAFEKYIPKMIFLCASLLSKLSF
ncbi:hypothetical protein [Aureibacter tunicatorum]|uniref:HEAT repeat protein n=1 Tax=Aureibacter tunicatorum TaxID=866807 RepID=A0AAE3XRQ9_9BACT|nr:hypothetical protein [Aureibacter tunicatorum]MDR6241922.1 hypothetical protein [Aureibacter tunicatorum]BDD07471.1 hypothetical protein AUTU_49540 [Aureibacter tunicatorum]